MLSKLLQRLRTWLTPPTPPPPPAPNPYVAPAPQVGALGVSDAGLALIREFEGLRLQAYLCPAGVWTVGYGATGPDITSGTVWTEDQANLDLTRRCTILGYRISQASGRSLTQGQTDALVSFAYNLGLRALLSSTLWYRLQCGDVAGAADQFGRWVHADGRPLPGLVRRRTREREVFLG